MPLRVTIVTSGHLATCPRMLKAADAIDAAGYHLRVISGRCTDWAAIADDNIRKSRNWRWDVVDYHCGSNRRNYLFSGVRFRAAGLLAKASRVKLGPLWFLARAFARVHPELVDEIALEPCDLIYGGTSGALAAVAIAARRANIPYALDLEDFHSAAMDDGPESHFVDSLAEQVERKILPGARFLTAGSAAIAEAYAQKYGVRAIPINNTFPLPPRAPDIAASEDPGLKLYWFSQTIGPGRGLEDVIRAMGLAGIPGALHLRGRADSAYLAVLERAVATCAPNWTIVAHAPGPPESMVDLCRAYDIGLAVEPGFSRNNLLALSNKIFTYMLAGLALVLTDTPGQRPVADHLGSDAIVYQPGDVATLASGLKSWATNHGNLLRAKAAAWQAAQRRWHWEHTLERGALLDAVAKAIGTPKTCTRDVTG